MKFRLVITSAVFLLSMSVPAFSQQWTRYTRYVDGQKYTFKVSADELQHQPSWSPENEDVPLSARKAVEIARTNLARILKAPEQWLLDDITLSRMGNDRWIYEVYFLCPGEDCGRPDSDWTFMIYVKMDGTIVEPEVAPWDGKSKVY